MLRDQPPPTWLLVAVFAFAVATSAFDYSVRISENTRAFRVDLHRAIVDGTAGHPYAHRVLVPMTLEAPIRTAARLMPPSAAFGRVYALFHFAALTLLLWTLYRYLAVWFDPSHALVGTLLVAATLPIALRHHEYQPWSLLEPTFVAAALHAMVFDRRVVLAILIVLATLNRETGIFLVFLYGVTRARDLATARWCVLYAGLWFAVFMGLRWVIPGSAAWGLRGIWLDNIKPEQLALTAVNVTLLLGAFVPLAWAGYRRAPLFLQRAALMVPPYLAVIAVFGQWWEVRLLMPLYPVLVPLALATLFQPQSIPRHEETRIAA